MADSHSTTRDSRRTTRALAAIAVCGLLASHAPPLRAQGAGPPQSAPMAYRPPAIVLAQPTAGATVPQDKPVVVFRITQGEPADPVDAASFRVLVDGVDRSALFQVSGGEAWGPLAPPISDSTALVPGEHQLAARICSSRGACGTVAAAVTVVPGLAKAADPADSHNRRQWLIDLLITAARKLIAP